MEEWKGGRLPLTRHSFRPDDEADVNLETCFGISIAFVMASLAHGIYYGIPIALTIHSL